MFGLVVMILGFTNLHSYFSHRTLCWHGLEYTGTSVCWIVYYVCCGGIVFGVDITMLGQVADDIDA